MKVLESIEALSDEDAIYGKLMVDHGAVIGFTAVQISLVGGQRHQVVRYDCAHGYAHKDCLYEHKQRKEGLLDRPLDELYLMSLTEIRRNWAHWRATYIKNNLK